MRVLTYWKKMRFVEKHWEPLHSFTITSPQVVQEEALGKEAFDVILEYIKKNEFSYKLTQIDKKLLEERDALG